MAERSEARSGEVRSEAPKKRAAPAHKAGLSTESYGAGQQGGRITARCVCGWEAHDTYERDRFADSVRSVVWEAAVRHTSSPEEPEPLS